MMDTNEIANALSNKLKIYGSSELYFSRSLFSRESSEKAGISGEINGRHFKAIMFEPSNENGFPSISIHLSCSVSDLQLSDEQIAFWNADNRFTKLYRQDEGNDFMVLDSFFPSSGEEAFIQSVAKMWVFAMEELRKFKTACERSGIF